MLQRVLRKIRFIKKNRQIRKFDGKFSFDIKNAIVISGVPRGGSTWFAELISNNKTALIWEPLQPEFYPEIKKFNFKERQFIAPEENNEEFFKTFERVMSGNHLTRGIMQRTEVDDLKTANHLIIKFCRANRLLPWLTSNFDFAKTIHLLRHPCAVVSSQLRFGAWDDVEHFFTEEELRPDGYIEQFYPVLKEINTLEEKLTAIWCLDNLIPLTQNHDSKWVTITYENLLSKPEKVFKHMGMEFTDEIKAKMYKPSSTTKAGSPIENSTLEIDNQLSYWKQTLEPRQLELIFNILKKFEITVYNSDIYPNFEF